MTAEDSVLGNMREAIRGYFLPRRHSILLGAIVLALAVRPLLGDRGSGPVVFSIALLVLMLVALYSIQTEELVGEQKTLLAEKRRRSIVGWTLAVLAAGDRFAAIFMPTHSLYLAGSICWLLFFVFITWNELRAVLRQKEVTRETISLSISIYLLLGFTWALLFIVINNVQSQAFSFGGSQISNSSPASEQQDFPILIYFSLTTLATIGYGDITPLSLQARYAAVAEGITGQFYLAILVARLVGIQMTQSASRDAERRTLDADTKRVS